MTSPPPPPLTYMTVGIFAKIFSRGDQDFFVKIGGSPYSHIGVGCEGGGGGELSIEKEVSTGFH